MTPQEGFISRLHWHRQRAHVTLDQIAEKTRVSRELLEAFEANDLSQWPRGLYSRAWIRGYAVSVGLDAEETVEEFCRLFPQGDRRAQDTIQGIAAIVAEPSEYRDDIAHEERRRSPQLNIMPKPLWHEPLKQAGKTLLTRLDKLKDAPSLKPRRPRTSS